MGAVHATHKNQSVVRAQWGKAIWKSATHVRIPLTMHIQDDWKICGPYLDTKIVGQPTIISWGQSTNVWHIDAHWPTASLVPTSGGSLPVYQKTFVIDMDVALKDRSPAQIKLVVQGLACSTVCQPFEIALPRCDLTPPAVDWSSWWSMLGLAFLGGVVLNIMPCVLPVLALKLKSLTQKGSGTLRTVCAVTAGGIVTGFWMLAALTIVVKSIFQQQVGWGMHLQNPYFVTVMVILMMFGGMGLMGIFHINTPRWASAVISPGKGRSVYTQSFISGLVAVLLATPCSAPFLGTALGFALTGQGIEIFVFYTAIALGFALPYLLGLIFPIDKILPKPGTWMVTFEKILGFFLMLSAGWFVSNSLGGLLGVPWDKLALILWAVWMVLPLLAHISKVHKHPRLYAILFYGIPVVFAAAMVIFPALPGPVEHPISMQDGDIVWEKFSTQRLDSALREHKVVVVDLTGMACALCIVNKSVFHSEAVQKVLTQKKIVCLRGDLTRMNAKLMMFLRKYGRSAIPFNLVISALHPEGIVLSENLTISSLLRAVEAVQKGEEPEAQN